MCVCVFQENSAILKELIELRAQKSSLLDFSTHADFVLEMNMAKSGKKVAIFLGEAEQMRCSCVPVFNPPCASRQRLPNKTRQMRRTFFYRVISSFHSRVCVSFTLIPICETLVTSLSHSLSHRDRRHLKTSGRNADK